MSAKNLHFPTELSAIHERIAAIDPDKYAATRNYLDGSVTYLSPYISRGVISTRQIFEHVMSRDLPFERVEKFVQELAWRDYWQRLWNLRGAEINEDLKRPQDNVESKGITLAILQAKTGIVAIDESIGTLYETGYMHNHLRMYVASLSCNIANNHWLIPAKWMYYHLLDGDWASNALSWQWVAGTNSSKKYFANQENISKYCKSNQKNSFLDVGYDQFPLQMIPEQLAATTVFEGLTDLENETNSLTIDHSIPTCIYNYYNIDPEWRKGMNANRIYLLDPSVFDAYPVSKKCLDFSIELTKNIDNVQVYIGSFDDLLKEYNLKEQDVYYKQHPLNDYRGNEDSRDFIFEESSKLNSFFAYWKRCKKELKRA